MISHTFSYLRYVRFHFFARLPDTTAMDTEDQMRLTLSITDPPEDRGTIERMQRELRFVAETVTAILDNLPVQRRPPSDWTKAVHVRVTWLRRNGLCSCCQKEQVCGPEGKLPGAEFDHWYGRYRNRPEETWLVCAACNRRLERTEFKAAVRSSFEAYQGALQPFLAGGQDQLFQ